jgi:glycosyltransferase involved in cell wall biosynthesis
VGDPDQPQPLFAVAMPACNAAATIDEALDSVLAQTFTAWELVVVDDGSTDDTRARAEAFAARDPRIRVVTQPNGGVGAARARAIAATTAPWIVNFDADDVLLPQCLATYARTMAQHPERHILSCDMEIFGPAVATHRRSDDRPLPTDQEFRLEDIIEGCWITNPASVISRQLYERIGGLRTDIYAEDYDLWLRALAHGGRHLLVPESLVRYRVSPTQQTAAASRSLAGAAEALRSLATSGLLDAAAADRCRLSAGRHDAMAREHERRRRGIAARQDLETRLRRGDMTNARRDLIRARHGYQSKAKLALAGSVFLASPRLYVAYLRHLRDTAMSPATALQEGGAPLTHSFADVTAHADASHPLFAIVMPACNAEETIAEALASVLAQTFSAWELVVVDDGSTDDTRARAEDFAARDPRIRVLRQPNAGPGAARNRAVAASSAPFIVCVDADDVLLPHCLATYAAVIRANPSHELFSCDMEVFDGEGELGLLYELAGQPYRAEVTLEDQLQANLIVGGAAVISRRLYRLLGGQKPRRHAEDYDLWLRALAHGGRHLMVPEALARYRRSPSQLSARSDLGYEATAAALRDLSTSGLLDRRLARSARASARRHERMARRDRARRQRTALELRLCDGNLRHARRDFLRALPAYDSRLKLALAGPVFLVCPRLYRLRVRHLLSCATGPTASTPPPP